MKSLFKILIVFLLGIGFSACENAKSGKKPTVITGQAVVNFEAKTVQCNGYVETAGSSAVYDRGICYSSEDKKPTLKDNHVSAGEGLGDFSCTLTKIKEGKYKYCAYATNETGTAYGDTVVFVMSAENGENGGENGGGSGGNGGENGGGNGGGVNDPEPLQGSYIVIANKVTYLKLAIFEITYRYAVTPAFYTYTTLKFYDVDNTYVFLVYGGCYAAISSLPTGSWDFAGSYRTNYHEYNGWWSKALGSTKEVAFKSCVVKQNGSFYTIDIAIDDTSKLHYEGAVQQTTRTENYN